MSLENFMNSLADHAEVSMDREYYEIEKQYEHKFGHIVPKEMLPPAITNDDIKNAMKECIASGKDDLFSILNVEVNEDYMY